MTTSISFNTLLCWCILISVSHKALSNLNQLQHSDNWLSWDEDADVEVIQVKRWTRNGICDHDTLTSILLSLILNAQVKMRTFDPRTRLPPLDPINITRHDFEMSESKKYSIKGELMDVLVEGMSLFNILDISSDLENMSANISLRLDSLRILGNYSLRGRIAYIIPIFGRGRFLLHPKQLQVDLYTKLGFKEGHLELQFFDFAVSLDDIFVKLNGILGARRRVSGAFNKILNSFGIKLFRRLEPKIHERVRNRGINATNKFLQELKFDEDAVMGMLQIPMRCMFG